jgi:hypothetical protein
MSKNLQIFFIKFMDLLGLAILKNQTNYSKIISIMIENYINIKFQVLWEAKFA